ncbi:hypothetical protein [Flavivirga algicola]|uniref:Uncharacterized protein n=1 Tax=Flavivirga algicola TaxID=2729136 RepID=A0ABX1RXF6_9FLAO|nr:hypothetical protein [Flavivirga algicola]NMH88256.1 hypothetical protein [Flavivirga algicola]
MHKLILYLLFIFITFSSFAQTIDESKSILVFSNEPGFLRPFIETTIKELKNTTLDKPYFKEVYSLNNYDEDTVIRSKISRIMWEQENAPDLISNKPLSNADIEFQDEIIIKLTKYDYFLTVKTNNLGELIEFQFQLFRTLKSDHKGHKNYLKRVLINNIIAVENFFINPKKSEYLADIKNAIQRLFKGTNRLPIADVEIFQKKIKTGDTIYISKGTKLKLDASNSGDYDSKNIFYSWRNIPNPDEKYQTFNKINIKDSIAIQDICINKNGPFRIGFQVSDGVNHSDEIKFVLITKEQPKQVKVSDSIFFTVTKKRDWRANNLNFMHRFNLENISSSESETPNILVSDKYLGSKLLSSHLKSSIDTLKVKVHKILLREHPFEQRYYSSSLNFFKSNSSNELYLYNVHKDSLLSKPTVLKHRTYVRNGISVKFLMGTYNVPNNIISFLETPDDTIRGGISIPKLKLGYYISNKIEIGLTIPLKKSPKFEYNNYEFSYPESFGGYILFHWYAQSRFINLYTGLNFNSFKYKPISNDPDIYTQSMFGLAPEVGARTRLVVTRFVDFRFFFGGTIYTFQNKNFNSLNGAFGVDMGFQFEI